MERGKRVLMFPMLETTPVLVAVDSALFVGMFVELMVVRFVYE